MVPESVEGDCTTAVVFDTETTGLVVGEDVAIQAAAVYVDLTGPGRITGFRTTFINPGDRAIDPRARAVHHIRDDQLRDAPRLEEAEAYLTEPDTSDGLFMAVAHNAEYDAEFLPLMKSVPLLCTYKMAKRIWQDAPAYGNQVLRYWLDLHPSIPVGLNPHDSLYDALTTAEILLAALRTGRSPGRLLAGTKRPMLLSRITFGKYGPKKNGGGPGIGRLWSDIPRSYLIWLKNDGIEDADVAHTVERYLSK